MPGVKLHLKRALASAWFARLFAGGRQTGAGLRPDRRVYPMDFFPLCR